ncbi:hypothetical protein, partial [Echinicola sediminis]
GQLGKTRARYLLFPGIPTPETGGLVCQFQHPTVSKDLLSFPYDTKIIQAGLNSNIFNKKV